MFVVEQLAETSMKNKGELLHDLKSIVPNTYDKGEDLHFLFRKPLVENMMKSIMRWQKTFVERLLQINRASEDQIFYQKVRKTVGLYGLDTTNHILKNFKSTNIVENEQEALQCFNLTNEIKSLPIYLVGIVF